MTLALILTGAAIGLTVYALFLGAILRQGGAASEPTAEIVQIRAYRLRRGVLVDRRV